MKKRTFFIGFVSSIIIPAALVFNVAGPAAPARAAACTTPTPAIGSASTSITVATAGTYRIWSRIMAPDATNNSYLLDIDGTTCFTVGDQPITANTWTWVDYQGGSANSKINVTLSAGTHTLKLIGREPNVAIDRVLVLADAACTPSGTGDNCAIKPDAISPTVDITAPTDNTNVSATVQISATAADNVRVEKVEFYTDGTLVLSDTAAPYTYNWDTIKLTNGPHTISVKAYDAAGNISTDSVQVQVANQDTQAPTVPANVKATATSYNKVDLSWTASTDNKSVAGYWISRDGTAIANVRGGTIYSDVAVTPGVTHKYQVSAYDEAGNTSQPSTAVSVKVPQPQTQDTQAPTKPVSLKATADSSTQINLTWQASTDNVAVKGYDVYRRTSTSAATKVATVTNTSFGDTGLTANTEYTYHIIARDAAGNSSPASDNAKATTKIAQQVTGIRGKISGANGRALRDAWIVVSINGNKQTFTARNDGTYVITGMSTKTYSVRYRADDYRKKTLQVEVKSGNVTLQNVTLERR